MADDQRKTHLARAPRDVGELDLDLVSSGAHDGIVLDAHDLRNGCQENAARSRARLTPGQPVARPAEQQEGARVETHQAFLVVIEDDVMIVRVVERLVCGAVQGASVDANFVAVRRLPIRADGGSIEAAHGKPQASRADDRVERLHAACNLERAALRVAIDVRHGVQGQHADVTNRGRDAIRHGEAMGLRVERRVAAAHFEVQMREADAGVAAPRDDLTALHRDFVRLQVDVEAVAAAPLLLGPGALCDGLGEAVEVRVDGEFPGLELNVQGFAVTEG